MGAYDQLSAADKANVDQLLAETEANGGLAPIDLEQFWADNHIAYHDPFGETIPQCSFGANLIWECPFENLGIEVDFYRHLTDPQWKHEVNKAFNDKAERIVGRRLLGEAPPTPDKQYPKRKGLEDVFEGKTVWEGGKAGSWWLMQSADTPEELRALLDRVEQRLENLRDFILPENWDTEKDRLMKLGVTPPVYRGQRGPCTFATSIYGAENMIFLCMDEPDLARRFSDLIARTIIGIAEILDEENGFTDATRPHGWRWYDDNCCLFNPEMYELFAMPIHRAVFARFAPNPEDRRYQHSDSAMGHLLPQLAAVDINRTNFGPTLTVTEIREALPNAIIDGQLAPFTYGRNEHANIVAEFLRDFEQAKETRGLNFETAGSVHYSTTLESQRLLMAAVQRFGRFE
jgi:uroporphyrinogen decarboxylase